LRMDQSCPWGSSWGMGARSPPRPSPHRPAPPGGKSARDLRRDDWRTGACVLSRLSHPGRQFETGSRIATRNGKCARPRLRHWPGGPQFGTVAFPIAGALSRWRSRSSTQGGARLAFSKRDARDKPRMEWGCLGWRGPGMAVCTSGLVPRMQHFGLDRRRLWGNSIRRGRRELPPTLRASPPGGGAGSMAKP
jgi:hypothetical protein